MILKFYILVLLYCSVLSVLTSQDTNPIDLPLKYAEEYFKEGIITLNDTQYERAQAEFLKALSYKSTYYPARVYLGESYRKSGDEKNAIITWNALFAMGYFDTLLKQKIHAIYFRKGTDINADMEKEYTFIDKILGRNSKEIFFLNPTCVINNKDNELYVTSFAGGKVLQYDLNGNLIWEYKRGKNSFKKPFGLCLDTDENLFISDFSRDVIVKYNKKKKYIKTFGQSGIGPGQLLGPKKITCDQKGNIYIIDSGNHRVAKFTSDGEFLFNIGAKGEGMKEFVNPSGLVYHNELLYVADRDNHRIHVLDKNGTHQYFITQDFIRYPNDLYFDSARRLIVICKDDIWIYEQKKDLWYPFYRNGTNLNQPLSITQNNNKVFYIADFFNSNVYLLNSTKSRYQNLNATIERVLFRKHPTIHLLVSILNKKGEAVQGLQIDNFEVFENGSKVFNLSLDNTKSRNNNFDYIILNDKSISMNKYHNDRIQVLDTIFSQKINGIDEFGLVEFAREIQYEYELGTSRLTLLDKVSHKDYQKGKYFSKALYKSITALINRLSNKHIIILTSGDIADEEYMHYSLDHIVSYAINNHVKISVISFNKNEGNNTLQFLTKKTGGDFYLAFQSREILKILEKIRNKFNPEYVVSYRSHSKKTLDESPVNVELRVNVHSQFGKAKQLYYILN